MNDWFWTTIAPYSQSRWWFGLPALGVLALAVLLLLTAATRLHRHNLVSIVLTTLALGVAVALLLPGALLALAPLDVLGLHGANPASLPTATFPAAARTLDQAVQMGYLGSGALLLGVLGLGVFGARRYAACPNCGRELHPSWNGECPECRLMEPTISHGATRPANLHSDAPITQFGGPAQTALLADAAGEAAWVEVAEGPSGVGEHFAVGTRLAIGRDPNQCQLVLDDEAVSARHAYIERAGDAFVIRDWGSRNGLKVNNRLVAQQQLADGDTITIGRTTLRFGAALIEADSASAPTMLLDAGATGARLVALDGPLDGETFALDQLDVQLGRGRHNQVVIDAPTVSRHHADIRFDGVAYHLVDAGSPNGTWLDEQRIIGSSRLQPGAIIRLGQQRLRFDIEEAGNATQN